MFSGPQIVTHASEGVGFTPFEAKWIPDEASFVVLGENANRTGSFSIYALTSSGIKKSEHFKKGNGFRCGTFGASLPGDKHLATGSFNGKLSIWDMNKPQEPFFEVQAHENLINSIDGCGGLIGKGAPEIVTAGRDGSIKVWDPRQQEPVSCMAPMEGEKAREAWTVCFGDSFDDHHRSVCAGYDNGDIKLLDLSTQELIWETNLGNGVCSLDFDRKDIKKNKLLCTTLESSFRVYDVRTFHKKAGFAHVAETAHESTIWKGHHLPSDRDQFVTCGGNGVVSLWQYEYPKKRELDGRGVAGQFKKRSSQKLSTQPINSWHFHPDKKGLAVCTTLDQKINVVFITKI